MPQPCGGYHTHLKECDFCNEFHVLEGSPSEDTKDDVIRWVKDPIFRELCSLLPWEIHHIY